ncbi:hypothetical protein BC826DRAFT_1047844 [Russula brevipes]|nr:hypothetical protein BC826DRAFT_1047844 [Russula brevipes]
MTLALEGPCLCPEGLCRRDPTHPHLAAAACNNIAIARLSSAVTHPKGEAPSRQHRGRTMSPRRVTLRVTRPSPQVGCTTALLAQPGSNRAPLECRTFTQRRLKRCASAGASCSRARLRVRRWSYSTWTVGRSLKLYPLPARGRFRQATTRFLPSDHCGYFFFRFRFGSHIIWFSLD